MPLFNFLLLLPSAIKRKYAVSSIQLAEKTANRQLITANSIKGGLAQLARALAWHARGHRFDSDILHRLKPDLLVGLFVYF